MGKVKQNMKEILKKLGIDALEESQQNEIAGKLDAIIALKVEEKTERVLEKEKVKLEKKYESIFESYKDDITKKVSDFLDETLQNEINIPEKVLENARKGELYGELIEQFKVHLAIDEDVLNGEVKSLLKEAKDEIKQLSKKVNKVTEENLKHKTDARDFALELYKLQKVEEMGLSRREKKYVINLLEDSKTRKDVNNKLRYIKESKGLKGKSKDLKVEEKIKKMKSKARKGKTSVKKIQEEDDKDFSRTSQYAKFVGWV